MAGILLKEATKKFGTITAVNRVNLAVRDKEFIEDLLDRKPKALSGGQRQRVAMGRAIVRKPRAFLFDEPLSFLMPVPSR